MNKIILLSTAYKPRQKSMLGPQVITDWDLIISAHNAETHHTSSQVDMAVTNNSSIEKKYHMSSFISSTRV